MLKLIWSLTLIVVLIGVVRWVVVSNAEHSSDQQVLIKKSK